ncbi:GDSL-type esterase/lipase family protein [Tunicatimonas pelagia]|uniref:GDSL-type esterase/lipase family protein n=1 Tax=Tunicatimonas pelagia TaxID=931531 RepID=UPI002666CACF|nr:GDSL-type esterase/lipase family protein [Tunicatimonas pelagia]WKN43920.1 GDSL-type esterase/lipase family protein [Tunicatimonas pelagia]
MSLSLIAKTISGILGATIFAFVAVAQEQGPERWEKTIQKFEQQDAQNSVEPGAILFTGSSSIAMWQDISDYFPNQRIVNRGFGGSQFSDLLHYADRVISPYRPSKIFIYEGDNDISAGDSPKQIMREAKKLRKKIKKALGDTPVIFISPKPSVARWELKETYEDLNARLKKYADKTENTEFADVWNPALDDNGEVVEHIFLEDNLHMNAEGYKIWQQALAPYVE